MAVPKTLLEYIDVPSCCCLNEKSDHKLESALKFAGPGRFLEVCAVPMRPVSPPSHWFSDEGVVVDGVGAQSEVDAQLLIHIAFTDRVKIHSMVVRGNPDDGSAPLKLNLFANSSLNSFEEAVDMVPTQSVTLTREQISADDDGRVLLNFVRFQNVESIDIFVESNFGGVPTTRVTNLKLYGFAAPTGCRMSEFGKAPPGGH